MHVYCAQVRCVLFRWEYDLKGTQCEDEWICIASVETLYEIAGYELNEIDCTVIYDWLYHHVGKN